MRGLMAWGARCISRRVLRNVREGSATFDKRALVSYLVTPLLLPAALRDHTKYSNRGLAQDIPRALNELGYVVDVVNYDNLTWSPDSGYDLFVGHGGVNFQKLAEGVGHAQPWVYFATGIYWKELNRRVRIRERELQERRGGWLRATRQVVASEDFAVLESDGVACLGNRSAASTYSAARAVFGLPNAVFALPYEVDLPRDPEAVRHLLFFAGHGNVLKGLDVLLEAVQGTDLHLHVCQRIEPEFAREFARELSQPNVHLHGFVRMRSRRFRALASNCAWVVSASCAEGQPGAILECMAHGLIPIVTEESHIDSDSGALILPSRSVPEARKALLQAAASGRADVEALSERVRHAIETRHTPAAFRQRFSESVASIASSFAMRR